MYKRQLWGGDPLWLDHFYEAAYKGRASEFEAPSEMLQQFFRAEVFPISEGLCGFTIHDVTDWILPAQRSMEKAVSYTHLDVYKRQGRGRAW